MKCGDTDVPLSWFESIRRTRADARLTQDKVDVVSEAGKKKSLAEEAGSSSSSPFIKRIRSVGICGDETL